MSTMPREFGVSAYPLKPSASPKRVLIVDDDRDFSAAIGEILDAEGYAVCVAHSAQDACAQAVRHDARVALLDIRLGRDSGIELMGMLQAERPGILCVMMTGHAALETAIQALQRGAYNYLRKPIDGLDLLTTLERCFEKIALEEGKQRAEEALNERNADLVTMSVRLREVVEATRRLAGVQRLEILMPLLFEEFKLTAGAEYGALYLRSDEDFDLVQCDAPESLPRRVRLVELRSGRLQDLVENRAPVLLADCRFSVCLCPDRLDHNPAGSLLAMPLFGDGEQLSGFVLLYRDALSPFLTEDKDLASLLSSVSSEILRTAEASEALSKSEQRYRLLTDNVADIIWTIGIDGVVTYVSPSVRAVCGYAPDQAVGRAIEFCMAEKSSIAVRRLLKDSTEAPESLRAGVARGMELELRHQSGTVVLTDTRLMLLRGEGGAMVGLLAVSRDISDRKRAEEARSRLAAAVEHAAESIMITDSDGVIQYVNPAFVKLMGYSPEESLGKTPRILKSGRMGDDFYAHLWKTILTGNVWHGRVINRTKSGQFLEQEATISAIRDGRGEIQSFVSVARDVTHEVELEARLRQSQKLEAIGTLAGGIAHDFNNMLSPILGYAELALMSAERGSELWHHLSEIHSAGKRASELVKQILAFSRRSDQERRRVKMKSIVSECALLLRGSLPSTISIEMDLEDCPPILADTTQMHQVIMNLCTNAYHAMRERGGVLTIGLNPVTIAADSRKTSPNLPPGSYVRLSVADTGLGMTEETLERIFEPYFTTKKVGEGTGLGLATVHGIVQGHQGYVTAASTLERGSVFSVYLPAADSDDEGAGALSPELGGGPGQECVLVVDDEPPIVAMITRGLETMGYTVDGFTDSLLALDAFSAAPEKYDVILSDQTMPKLTGMELARKALQLRPDIPIILTTGYSDSVNEHSARKAGIRDFLFKPASPRIIAEHIRKLLDAPRL